MGKLITNGNWSRIGDNAFGLGLQRYTSGTGMGEKVLWRLEITGNASTKLAQFDAKIRDLREIAIWCERAIETLQSDGGRDVEEAPAAEQAA